MLMQRVLALIFTLSISLPLFSSQPSTEVARLITRLGDKNFVVRSQACEKLTSMGTAIIPQLKEALRHPDLEIRRYARALLEQARVKQRVEQGMQSKPILLTSKRRPLSQILDELKKKTGIRYQIRSDAHDVPINPPAQPLPLLSLLENLMEKSGNELDMDRDLFTPSIIIRKASVPRRRISIVGSLAAHISELEPDSTEDKKRGPVLLVKPGLILDPSRHYMRPPSETDGNPMEVLEAITDSRERLRMLSSDQSSVILSAPKEKATKLSVLKVKTSQEIYGDRGVIDIPDFQDAISKAHKLRGVKIVPLDITRLRRRRYVVSFYMEITGNQVARGPFIQLYDEWGDAMSIDEERIVPQGKGVKVDLFTNRRWRGFSPEGMRVVFFGFAVKNSTVFHMRDIPLP